MGLGASVRVARKIASPRRQRVPHRKGILKHERGCDGPVVLLGKLVATVHERRDDTA